MCPAKGSRGGPEALRLDADRSAQLLLGEAALRDAVSGVAVERDREDPAHRAGEQRGDRPDDDADHHQRDSGRYQSVEGGDDPEDDEHDRR